MLEYLVTIGGMVELARFKLYMLRRAYPTQSLEVLVAIGINALLFRILHSYARMEQGAAVISVFASRHVGAIARDKKVFVSQRGVAPGQE